MPKGLAFLSKKSLHTGKLCNQEKVWIAEKAKEAEDAKIRELSRQIQQEREQEELERISGNKTKRLDRGIDWMYQGGQTSASAGGAMTAFEEEQKKKEAEEYLLGKEYNPSNVKSGDFAEAATGTSMGVNKIITATATVVETAPVESPSQVKNISAEQEWNTNFHLRYEDPMFMVEQRRKEKERDKEKKRQLFEGVNDQYRSNRGREKEKEMRDGDRYDRKRSRKDTSRHRDSRRRKRSNSSESMYESRRHLQKRDRKSRHKYHSRSTSRSRSRSPYRKRSHRRRRSRSHSYDYKRSWSRDREDRRARKSHHYDSRDRREDPSFQSDRNEEKDKSHRGESKQYGLIGASLSKPTDIGPDSSLIAKKRREKEEARSRYNRYNQGDTREKRRLTDEERAAALAEMQQNAKERVSIVSNEGTSKSSKSDLYEEEIQRRMQDKVSGAHRSFLEDATVKAHAIDGSQAMSLSSRLAATRHRHQRDDA
jgi:hypothetical protein